MEAYVLQNAFGFLLFIRGQIKIYYMKNILFLIVLCVFSLEAASQDSSSNKSSIPDISQSNKMKKECILMKNGLALVVKYGDTTTLSSPIKLDNGSTVFPDGKITMSDGTSKKLKNGQYVNMDGKIGTLKK